MPSNDVFTPDDDLRVLTGAFTIEGKVSLETAEQPPSDLKLMAFVFDDGGELLGSSEVTPKGTFKLALNRKQVAGANLVIGPGDDPEPLKRSAAYSRRISALDWIEERGSYAFRPEIVIAQDVWFPWRPVQICISGHVRKIHSENGATQTCPVPFVKVEIFDVDRENCWWPWILKWRDTLLDRKVFRVPDLVKDPIGPPIPEPDPLPFGSLLDTVALNPQPLPPREIAGVARVGEMKLLPAEIASRLDKLTLTALDPPWVLFPRCFYSKKLVCTTYTKCDGYFKCCFKWPQFHFRNGRLRFDARPDVIIRVTQVINGVPKVIYLDPYTSTRWNLNSAHIDLFLDDPNIICGTGCFPQPAGTTVFFNRIGVDEVYQINQASGLFAGGGLSNCAYGGSLQLHAVFGSALTSGAPKRYYRLSVRKSGGAFQPLNTTLTDTRVDKVTLTSQYHTLGPQVVNGTQNLYEIRDMSNFFWYNSDLAGYWDTNASEADEGKYTLRLEVFDDNGVHLTSAVVDYRDGTVPPPGPLPAMPDHCDLVIQVDNKPPTVDMQIPAAGGVCGVVKWANVPLLAINTTVNQENGRLHSWSLSYVKGLTGVSVGLAGASNGAGLPVPQVVSSSGAPMTVGLTGTCAFALTLGAWALIRNGFGLIYFQSVTKAIAVEKCG